MTGGDGFVLISYLADGPEVVLDAPPDPHRRPLAFDIVIGRPTVQVVLPDLGRDAEVVLRCARPAEATLVANQPCVLRTAVAPEASLRLSVEAQVVALHPQGTLRLARADRIGTLRCEATDRLRVEAALTVDEVVVEGCTTVSTGSGISLGIRRLRGSGAVILDGAELVLGDGPAEAGDELAIAGAGHLEVTAGTHRLTLSGSDLAVAVGERAVLVADGRVGRVEVGAQGTLEAPPGSDGLRPSSLACGDGARVLGLVPYDLDEASIRSLRQAARVTLHLPGSHAEHLKAAVRSAPAGTDLSWRWRELTAVVADAAGPPLVRARCAEAEMEARRIEAGWSLTGVALTGYRALGYGLRPLRPWLLHAALCVVLAAVLAATGDLSVREDVLRAPQLFFAGLGFLDIPAIELVAVPGVWDTAAWILASVSGLAAGVASVLSLRPYLSRA